MLNHKRVPLYVLVKTWENIMYLCVYNCFLIENILNYFFYDDFDHFILKT